jgi:stage V sporulation protein G
MLEFSDIRVRKIVSENRCKAIVSIVVNNALCINNIKVIESQNGPFIAMPNIRTANGEFKDLVFPLNQETRMAMQEAILNKYNKIT